MDKVEMQKQIAKRAATELKGRLIVNLGIGIPLFIPQYLTANNQIYFHTENGLLGVGDLKEDEEVNPHLVNAGKRPISEEIGASYFDSATSFAMIRGGHIDVAILGALQVNERGQIANWAIPGKNIIGVGGAMDLLTGAKKVIVTMSHTDKYGNSKIVNECAFPLTSERAVDLIVTEMAVFSVKENQLYLIELLNNYSLNEVERHTEASFTNYLKEKTW